LQDQLGLVVAEVEPFGLAGSAGSTPLRITVKGDPDTWLFAKLYAKSHLRADRWYKLGRELLYGRLEDEKPFNTVRRLVQQEDYALQSAFTLNHDRAGKGAMVVRLTAACNPAGATHMPSQRPGVRHYEQTERRAGQFTATWYDQFPGGCVTSRLDSTSDVDGKFATDAPHVLGFATRQALQHALAQRSNGRLHLDPAAG
jgi:hypothetical protein